MCTGKHREVKVSQSREWLSSAFLYRTDADGKELGFQDGHGGAHCSLALGGMEVLEFKVCEMAQQGNLTM